MFDVWGRVAETGSGNKWPLVAFESARLEQLEDMLTFCKGLRLLFYSTASLSHWHWPYSTCGVASRKPEVEISRGWWRFRVLGWSNVLHVVPSFSIANLSLSCACMLTKLLWFYFIGTWASYTHLRSQQPSLGCHYQKIYKTRIQCRNCMVGSYVFCTAGDRILCSKLLYVSKKRHRSVRKGTKRGDRINGWNWK